MLSGPLANGGLWHSVAVVYDGAGHLSLYIDYNLIYTATSFLPCNGVFSSVQYDTIGDSLVQHNILVTLKTWHSMAQHYQLLLLYSH